MQSILEMRPAKVRITIVVVLVLCVVLTAWWIVGGRSVPYLRQESEEGTVLYYSHLSDRTYVTLIRRHDLDTPLPWDGISTPHLAIERAVSIARDKAMEFEPEAKLWPLREASLQRYDTGKYYYLITFAPPLESRDPSLGIRIGVYMDGNTAQIRRPN